MSLLEEIRSWLAPLNERILHHPYLDEAEKGTLPLDNLKAFALNQYYIVTRDARSLALMVSRSTTEEELIFLNSILEGDVKALPMLVKMARALGLTVSVLEDYTPIPEAVVYAHYLTVLAHFGSPGEQALALTVNLPVWGANCVRLSRALRERYDVSETGFLDVFAQPMQEVEEAALPIIDRYRLRKKQMRRVARMIQAYELMFWDGIYRG